MSAGRENHAQEKSSIHPNTVASFTVQNSRSMETKLFGDGVSATLPRLEKEIYAGEI